MDLISTTKIEGYSSSEPQLNRFSTIMKEDPNFVDNTRVKDIVPQMLKPDRKNLKESANKIIPVGTRRNALIINEGHI